MKPHPYSDTGHNHGRPQRIPACTRRYKICAIRVAPPQCVDTVDGCSRCDLNNTLTSFAISITKTFTNVYDDVRIHTLGQYMKQRMGVQRGVVLHWHVAQPLLSST